MFENFSQEIGIFSNITNDKHEFFSLYVKREGELLVALLRAKMWLVSDGMGCVLNNDTALA
jgi:hypothetical protein